MCTQKIKEYTDLSFLKKKNICDLIDIIDTLSLTDEEKEKKARETEDELDKKLRTLNQIMQDTLQINVGYRVNLIAGMIMAGLGVDDKVPPLEISELKGSKGKKEHDGYVIINKIESFLDEKNLPSEKQELIIQTLSAAFIHGRLWIPVNGESKLKSIYTIIKNEIMSIFRTSYHLDFTGKLFNVLNEWVNKADLCDIFTEIHKQVRNGIKYSCYPYMATTPQDEEGDIACVLYQRDIREADDFDGMNVNKVEIAHNNAAAQSVLDIQILDSEDGLKYVFDYAVGRYKQETMSEFQNLFKRVVAAIVSNASTDGYDFEHLKKDVCGKKGLMQKIKDIFAKKK